MTGHEIEKTILGLCLHETVDDVIQRFSPDDFSADRHRDIFKAAVEVCESGGTPDILSLSERGCDAGYIAELTDLIPTTSNAPYLLGRFEEYAGKRKLISAAKQVQADISKPLSELQEILSNATIQTTNDGATKAGAVLGGVFKQLEKASQSRGQINGLKTSLQALDGKIDGIGRGEYVLIGARPSVGKTAIGLQIADSICVTHKKPGLFLSLETPKDKLVRRLMLARAKVNLSRARVGEFKGDEFARMQKAAEDIHQAPFYVEECAGCTPEQIAAKVKAAIRKYKIEVFFLDYLGLMTGDSNEYTKVTHSSQTMQRLIQQTKVPGVILHQLRRPQNEQAANQPTMNELRSSGQLEQDADVILLLHRKKEEPVEDMDLIIEKQKEGETGILGFRWNGPINRVEEI